MKRFNRSERVAENAPLSPALNGDIEMISTAKNVTLFFISSLLLSVSFSSANDAPPTQEIWSREKDGCTHGLKKQPNGPMAIMLFCEDAVGDYIGLIYYDHMEVPSPADFVRKLSETEKNTFYSLWSLGNRMWQESIWASDVTSYAWDPDNTKLYIATSEIYGSGALYELDLVRKKHKQIAPSGKEAQLNSPGPGYVITRIDKGEGKLFYRVPPTDDLKDQQQKDLFWKLK